jgi:homoserine dehydrogenase
LEQQYAKEKGLKIKLIAQAFKKPDGTITAFVAPKFVKPTDKLYQVNDVYNGVTLTTVFSEDQFFVGKGAGAYPTASAVISDLSALTYDYKYEYKKIRQNRHVEYSNDVLLRVFVRFDKDVKTPVLDYFEEVEEQFSNSEASYAIGVISLTDYIKLHDSNIASAILIETLADADTVDVEELATSVSEFS